MLKYRINTGTQLAFAAIMLIGGIGSASAQSASASSADWRADHPRRAQVNRRLDRQAARVHNEVAQGQITQDQAKALHQQDHQVRLQERAMARQNGGHITKAEQHSLNQQENAVSKEIGK